MKNKLLLPPGPIMRRTEGVMVCISGLGSILVYALIKFDICGTNNCSSLEITKFYASLPEIYLFYGFTSILAGIFLFSNKEVNRIFRFGIEMAIMTGFVLSGMIAFGMLIEIKSVT